MERVLPIEVIPKSQKSGAGPFCRSGKVKNANSLDKDTCANFYLG